MKKLFLFLFVSFFVLININAQSIVDTNKVWYNVERGSDGISVTSIFSFKGDTTIGGVKYKKVVAGDSSETVYNNPIAVREDTSTRQIFFYYPLAEYLAYDFSLQLDSTFMTYIDGCVVQYMVVSIDSITLLNGEKRKRIILHGSSQIEQWIEGIGSNLGLFRVGRDFCPFDSRKSWLNCFIENDTLKYHNPGYSSCYTLTGINEISERSDISISPNPFATSTQITLDKTYHNISLVVYDIQGKLMLQKQYADCNQIQLNRNGLSNGMYFMKLRLDERRVETGKIVVSE